MNIAKLIAKEFNILEKARDSIKEKDRGMLKRLILGGKQAKISGEAKDDMIANGMQKDVGKWKTEGGFFGLGKPSEAKLNRYFNELIEKEASSKPELFGAIKQNRFEINDIKAKLNFINEREEKIAEVKKSFDDAKKIKQEYANRVDKYKENSGGARLGMALGAKVVSPARFVVRNTNSLFKSVRDGGAVTVDFMRNTYNGDKTSNLYKENKDVSMLPTPPILKEREKYKSAVKALKEFNDKNPEKFVKNHQKTLKTLNRSSSDGGGVRAEPPSLTSNLPSNLTSTNIST